MSVDIEKLKATGRAADPHGAAHLVTHYRNSADVKAEEAWRIAANPAAVLELIAENERLRTELAASATPVIPTGEQLYMMVTSRFKSGAFPWAMVAESGKAAWSAAAADLILSPDTILARHQPGKEQG